VACVTLTPAARALRRITAMILPTQNPYNRAFTRFAAAFLP
jgi:hypothetical protein